jgi:tRNA threonylcarbamoyladenosine biosynthesis protein TsaE
MQKIFENIEIDRISIVSEYIISILSQKPILLLEGNLGAGKTTLVKEICKSMGIYTQSNSPTFGIVNEYKSETKVIYHLDLYRLKNIEEFWMIGGSEIISGENICFVEWPQIIDEYIDPKSSINVSITTGNSPNQRTFIIGS